MRLEYSQIAFQYFYRLFSESQKLLRKLLLRAACCTIIYGRKYRSNINYLKPLILKMSKTEAFIMGNGGTTSRVYNQFM